MRIRKNVKLSSVMPPEMLQTHVCQLNQSPWDVISFSQQTDTSSLNHQLEGKGEGAFIEDERLGDKIGDVNGSATSLIEIEESVCCSKNSKLTQLCNSKTNVPTNGFVIKKPEKMKTMETTVCRGRTRVSKTGSTLIFDKCTEFYYYSGFGPFRGKKRGELGGEVNKNVTNCTQNNSNNKLNYRVDEVHEADNNGDADKEDEDDKNDKKKKRKLVKARSLQSLM